MPNGPGSCSTLPTRPNWRCSPQRPWETRPVHFDGYFMPGRAPTREPLLDQELSGYSACFMIGFLHRLFEKVKAKPVPPQIISGNSKPEDLTTKQTNLLTVDVDRISPENRPAIYAELVKHSSFPLFEGEIEHAYSKVSAGNTAICPRRHGPTHQQCANFVYATDVAARVMLAPVGFFCTRCPTVIVDDELIAKGMKAGLKFRGVLGIDYGGKKDPSLFRTWNGEKTVYLLDEKEQLLGLSTVAQQDPWIGHLPPPQPHNRQKMKWKRKLAKRARQRNRRS